ncbi:MAG TPA: hypothetical protein VKI43_07370, partial [Vicinamibacterales bacterium]|nr:hypothetical protein [Vicinamibacterales bacterium]
MRRLTFMAFAIAAAVLVWHPQTALTAAPDATFTRDVAPILHAKCAACHRAGEVAPMALLTYQDARPWARAIKDKVVSRQMPPWFADPNVGSFANDPSLTAAEIATITKWVDGGAPQGDLKDMPKMPQFVEGWQLGEPDLVVELPEIQIPATGGDYFPTPNLTLPLTEDRWIRAVEIRPSNREVTHHSVIFSADVGAAMRMGASAINPSGVFDVLAVWAVGTPATVYPEGTGRWVRKGQTLRTNLHYHPNGKAQTDRTRIGLYFGKGELKKEVAASLAGNINFTIPPQARDYEMRAAYVADQDINIVSFFPHMHLRGTDMTMTATYPDGRTAPLLHVPAYDFNWQLFYYPKTTVRLPKGTRIDLVAHYDNSSANKHNPDPNRAVTFGEASTNEMMFGMFEFTAADGVSPKPSSSRARIQLLRSSFADSAYVVDLATPGQRTLLGGAVVTEDRTIPSVLHIPRSGEGSWYVPTLGMITVAPIKDIQWTGNNYQFTASLRIGTGPAPFLVKGSVQEDGSIRAAVEPI